MRRKRTPYRGRVRKEDLHKINDKITVSEVRLVGDNVESAVMSTPAALVLAKELELDLVEISPKADPPVCRIIEYKKFLYDQKKKQKEMKAKQQKVVVKEIRFGPNTDDHDFNFKLKHAKKFLEEGSKLKAYVFFRGRTIVFKERGEILLLKFAQELEEFGTVEQLPRLEGKRMTVLFNPKKK
ncbi:MAG: translation initiation factor IF-3 [Crocinitomicaceae bacterium]|nr:translation initiation factor IF-3 [Crocinitomicaceae bacterium]